MRPHPHQQADSIEKGDVQAEDPRPDPIGLELDGLLGIGKSFDELVEGSVGGGEVGVEDVGGGGEVAGGEGGVALASSAII